MNFEAAINLNGMVVEVQTGIDTIKFNKGSQFEAEMANKTQVVADDGVRLISIAGSRRAWMHRKLDAWIDGVEDE
jgi:hypothetical protein